MNFRDALMTVRDDIEAAEVPADLRDKAFEIGMQHYLAGVVPAADEPALVVRTDIPRFPQPATPPAMGSRLEAVAHRLNLPAEDVAEVFNFSDIGPELIVGSGKLSQQLAAATKEIAVLIAAARQATGEEWTPFGEIRTVCSLYGKLDSANFASTMKELEDVFNFRSPSPRKREVRLNRPGWERATMLVSRLVSGS